jgi:ketosteroid isomerase-like protein
MQIGRTAIDASFARAANRPKTYEVLEYRFDLSEPEIVGNIAIEYGLIHGRTRDLNTGEVTTALYNVLRVLRKEDDGQWRVYRTIWAPG